MVLWAYKLWMLLGILPRERVSMSAEKIFCGESLALLFVFWVLFLVLNGVFDSVLAVFA